MFLQFRDMPIGQKFTVNYSGAPYVKVSVSLAEHYIGLNEVKSASGQLVALTPSEYVTLAYFDVQSTQENQ